MGANTNKRVKSHIKKNDMVMVISGKERGKRGRVQFVIPKKERAIVEKVNIVKRHLRPTRADQQQAGIIEKEAPIHISNLMVVCGKCDQPTRIGKRILENGKRVRVCKKCGEMLDRG